MIPSSFKSCGNLINANFASHFAGALK